MDTVEQNHLISSISPQNYTLPTVLAVPFWSPFPLLLISMTSGGIIRDKYLVFVPVSWHTAPITLVVSRVIKAYSV